MTRVAIRNKPLINTAKPADEEANMAVKKAKRSVKKTVRKTAKKRVKKINTTALKSLNTQLTRIEKEAMGAIKKLKGLERNAIKMWNLWVNRLPAKKLIEAANTKKDQLFKEFLSYFKIPSHKELILLQKKLKAIEKKIRSSRK